MKRLKHCLSHMATYYTSCYWYRRSVRMSLLALGKEFQAYHYHWNDKIVRTTERNGVLRSHWFIILKISVCGGLPSLLCTLNCALRRVSVGYALQCHILVLLDSSGLVTRPKITSLSHRPTLITKSLCFGGFEISSGTRIYDFCSYISCPPRLSTCAMEDW